MATEGGNGIWRTAALMLASALVGLLPAFWRSQVSPEDLRRIEKIENDLVTENASYKQHLEYSDRNIDALKQEMHELGGQFRTLGAEVGGLSARFDMLTERRTHGR